MLSYIAAKFPNCKKQLKFVVVLVFPSNLLQGIRLDNMVIMAVTIHPLGIIDNPMWSKAVRLFLL